MKGSYVAIVTPFTESKEIDWPCLEQLILWQIKQGTDGIVCSGTTGESPALSAKEKVDLAKVCVEICAKKIRVIAGTGMSSTHETVALTDAVQKVGVDGALVVTPFYNRPTQRGLVAHFREVARVGLPLVAYNNPSRAAVSLTAESVAELEGTIEALKDSSHSAPFVERVRELSSVPIVAGDDDFTYEILKRGGVGAISVIGNAIPSAWKQMISLALQGEWEKAFSLSERFQPLIRTVFEETNPQGIKALLARMGRMKGHLRLPLVGVEADLDEAIWSQYSTALSSGVP
jgi:4-hydroxy-tetrahydrodipicolinate synthase